MLSRRFVVVVVLWLVAMGAKGTRQGDEFHEVRARAARGDATAQNQLGVMSHKGRGVPQDPPEAVKWCPKAADYGLAKAQYNLGLLYNVGRGVPQDDVEA